jgi:POT family proton-dependent oligopeptide transporter
MFVPKAIKYILWMDFADKYSFYGIKAILPTFLLSVISFSESQTVVLMQIFLSITYVAMILATFIAGKIISHKNLLTIATFISFTGHYILSYSEAEWNVYLGIIIISAGSGIIQICMPAMIVEQCNDDKKIINRSMSLIYLFTNIGTISILITPYLYNKFGYNLAFLSPTIAMFIAGLTLILGRKSYKTITLLPDKKIDFFVIKKLFWIMFVVSIFYVFMSQIYSSWVIQGGKMNSLIFGFIILPSQMQFLDTIFVVILLPIILFKLIPFLQSRGFFKTAISQINFGLFIAILSFICIAIIQYKIEQGIILSLSWQIIPYFLIAIAEILVRAVAINHLFSSAAPQNSVFIGLIFAIFNLIINTIFSFIFKQFCAINMQFFIFCIFILFIIWSLSVLFKQKSAI